MRARNDPLFSLTLLYLALRPSTRHQTQNVEPSSTKKLQCYSFQGRFVNKKELTALRSWSHSKRICNLGGIQDVGGSLVLRHSWYRMLM